MNSSSIWRKKESWYLLAFALLLIVSSIVNLGYLAVAGYLVLSILILRCGSNVGIIYLIMMYYLPAQGLNVPRVFLVSSVLVTLFNIKLVFSLEGYKRMKEIIILFISFTFLMILSGVYAPEKNMYEFYLSFLIYSVIHIVLCNNLARKEEDVDYCLKWWGLLGVLGAIVGYIHFSLQGHVYLTSIMNADFAGKVNLQSIDGDLWVRWIVAGSEPNYVGLNLLIPLGINIYYLTKKICFYNVLLVIINYLGLLGTFSRSSFLSSLVLVFLFVLFSKSSKKILFLIGGVGVALLLVKLFPEFIDRINTIQDTVETSGGNGRFERWSIAIDVWKEHPFLGVGMGQIRYYSPIHDVTHNTYLENLAEGGLFAFVLFLGMVIMYLVASYRYYKKSGVVLFLVTGIAFLINMNTVSQYDYRIMLTLFILFFVKYKQIEKCPQPLVPQE